MMMKKRSVFAFSAILLSVIASGMRPIYADVLNGGFEMGTFAGWSTTGDTSIVTSAFGSGPVAGDFEALVEGGTNGVSVPTLETFLGVTPGALDALGNGITHGGSAIQQTFTGTAGQVLSFDWNFITDEAPPSIFNDFAFWSLNSLSTLATANDTGLIPFGILLQTGFQKTSFVLPATGSYTLSFGLANVSDMLGTPQLLVDDVGLAAVPEPRYGGTIGGMFTAVFGIQLVVKRRARRRQANLEPDRAGWQG